MRVLVQRIQEAVSDTFTAPVRVWILFTVLILIGLIFGPLVF